MDIIFLTFVLFLLIPLTSSVAPSPPPIPVDFPPKTFEDILCSYGFPRGIFPQNIQEYKINRKSLRFIVQLNESDVVMYRNTKDEVKFDRTITGYLAQDKISKIEGISVKSWWWWSDIVQISHHIYYDDWIFYETVFAYAIEKRVEQFPECPQDWYRGTGSNNITGSTKTRA